MQQSLLEIPLDDALFKVLSSDSRREILRLLQERRMTGTELATRLELGKPAVSEHLKKLHDAGLVDRHDDPERRWVYFSLSRQGRDILEPRRTRFILVLGVAVAALLVGSLLGVAMYGLVAPAGEIGEPGGSTTGSGFGVAGQGAPAPVVDALGNGTVYIFAADDVDLQNGTIDTTRFYMVQDGGPVTAGAPRAQPGPEADPLQGAADDTTETQGTTDASGPLPGTEDVTDIVDAGLEDVDGGSVQDAVSTTPGTDASATAEGIEDAAPLQTPDLEGNGDAAPAPVDAPDAAVACSAGADGTLDADQTLETAVPVTGTADPLATTPVEDAANATTEGAANATVEDPCPDAASSTPDQQGQDAAELPEGASDADTAVIDADAPDASTATDAVEAAEDLDAAADSDEPVEGDASGVEADPDIEAGNGTGAAEAPPEEPLRDALSQLKPAPAPPAPVADETLRPGEEGREPTAEEPVPDAEGSGAVDAALTQQDGGSAHPEASDVPVVYVPGGEAGRPAPLLLIAAAALLAGLVVWARRR